MKKIITAATIMLLFLFTAATTTVAKNAKSLKSADEFFKKWCYGNKPNAPLQIKAICYLKGKIDYLYAYGDGDWTIVGDDMYSAVSGNVGIGTITPSAKLEVNGMVKMEEFQLGTATTEGYILTADSSGVGTWQAIPLVGLPSGTTGQTLRHNGTDWIATSNLYNNGTNVGIGTVSSGAKLHVNSESGVGIYVRSVGWTGVHIENYGESSGVGIYGRSYARWGTGVFGVADGDDAKGVWGYTTGGSSSIGVLGHATYGKAVFADANYGWGLYSAAPKNYFSGNVGIGTTDPSYKLDIYSTDSGVINIDGGENEDYTHGYWLDGRAALTTDSHDGTWLRLNQNNSWTGGVYTIGDFRVGGGSVTMENIPITSVETSVRWVNGNLQRTSSSLRYKEDIRDYDFDKEAFLSLQPVDFKWKEGVADGGESFGLIAEEVYEYMPEFVTWYDGEIDGVAYDMFVVPLISMVQEQEERIGELENGGIDVMSDLTISGKLVAETVVSQTATIDRGEFMRIEVEDLSVGASLEVAGLLTTEELQAGVLRAYEGENIVIELSESMGDTAFVIENSLGDTIFSIDSSGDLTVNKVNVFEEDEDSSIGTGVIKSGEEAVIIRTDQVTEDSKIFITPKKTSEGIPLLGIVEVSDGYFVIGCEEEKSEEIEFNWWVIN